MNFTVASTDRFRKTYRNCTHSEQKDIDQAIEEWQNSPDAKGSNFEKLNFAGNNIFSIRISRGGRIIMAKFESTYFLLHVDPNQHDKANNWARNKRIDRNLTTGAIQIFSTNVEEIEESIKQKTEVPYTHGFFKEYSDEDLKILGVPESWIPATRSIVNEDQLYDLSGSLPEDAWDNLCMLFDESAQKEILIAQLKTAIEEKPELLEDQLRVQPGIHLVSDYGDLVKVLKEDISLFRLYLHPTQKKFAFGDFKGPQKLIGSAGTGKTVVALNRAKYLAEKLTDESKPIFFTTYTNALINNVGSVFRAEGISKKKVYVSTIHSLALKYGQRLELFPEKVKVLVNENEIRGFWQRFSRSHPEHASFPCEFLRSEYENVIQKFFVITEQDYLKVNRRGRKEGIRGEERKQLWKVFKDFEAYQLYRRSYSFSDLVFRLCVYLKQWPEYRPFSHIVCDEIQDFNNNEMRLLRYLVAEGPNDLFLSGDPFQNIYKRELRFIDSDINIRGNRSNKLKVNYRTTEEIRKKAISIIEDFIIEDFSGKRATFSGDTSLISGNQPIVHLFKNEGEFEDFLIKYIRENFGLVGLHEICICHRTEKGLANIEELLFKAKIGCTNLKRATSLNFIEDQGKVVLSTMHAIKGLEFKTVIVTGFDRSTFPFKPMGFNKWSDEDQHEHLKSEHALHYVAFSRAISNLIITGVGEGIDQFSE